MGANPTVYSSVSGPAKWAAVVALSFACGGGLVYSFTRSPRRSEAPGPVVKELPPREVARPAPPPRPEPAARAAPKQEMKDVQVATGPVVPAPDAAAPKVEDVPVAPAPSVVTPAPEPQPQTPTAPVARKINLNTATQAELELLPRVGPATAKAIIAYRGLHGPFRSVQDLDKVKGIGPKTLERLAPLVTVE